MQFYSGRPSLAAPVVSLAAKYSFVGEDWLE